MVLAPTRPRALIDELLIENLLPDLGLDELGGLFRERWTDFETLGHKTHTMAYDLGLVLESARDRCGRGRWLEWVDETAGIARRTAQRYIEFRELVGERANLDQLNGEWGILECIEALKPEKGDGPQDERRIFPVATPRDITIEPLDARQLTDSQLRRWRGRVDLVIESWPYGLGKTRQGYVDYTSYPEWLGDAVRCLEQLLEVLTPNGRVCLVLPFDTRLDGTPHPMVADLIVLAEKLGLKYRQHHIWPKHPLGQTSRSNARGSATPPSPTPNAPAAITGAEEILVFHVGDWNLGRIGEPTDLTGDEALLWTNAYWADLPGENDADYDCVFSDALVERLAKLYSFPLKSSGERSVIADFHTGRGTTPRSVMRLGRAFVGGDVNPTAVALSTNNVHAAYMAMATAEQ